MAMPGDESLTPQLVERSAAATRDQQWDIASALWERVVELNPVTAEFWFQLASCRAEQGFYEQAIQAFEQALSLGARYPWECAYRIALCAARAGDKDRALAWLERAFGKGCRWLDQAGHEPGFETLREEPRFQALVGWSVPDLSRAAGWQADLRLLAREIERIHYDPFRLITSEQFHNAVERLDEAIPTLDDAQILTRFLELLTLVGDGHTGKMVAEHPQWRLAVNVQFYKFPDGVFIIAAHPEHRHLLGLEVVNIGEMSINEVFHKLGTVTAHDNPMSLGLFSSYDLRRTPLLYGLGILPSPEVMPLVVRDRAGTAQRLVLVPDSRAPDIWDRLPDDWVRLVDAQDCGCPLHLKHPNTAYWMTPLQSIRAIYFQWNRVRDEADHPWKTFLSEVFDAVESPEIDRLIIDIRWNNGGNTFLVPPLLERVVRSKVNCKKQLFVVIGPRTFSAGQNAATLLERFTHAIFVGEPTGSSPNFIGETVKITLPYSRIAVSISDLFHQTSWPNDHRIWIAPTIYTLLTFEAYATHRDPALEAIESFSAQNPLAPVA